MHEEIYFWFILLLLLFDVITRKVSNVIAHYLKFGLEDLMRLRFKVSFSVINLSILPRFLLMFSKYFLIYS